MKALSLQQPWATLMAIGAKHIETRVWPTGYLGPLVIHASAKWSRDVLDELTLAMKPPICDDDSDWRRIIAALVKAGYATLGELPLGAVLCVVEVKGCCRTDSAAGHLEEDELAFGDYSPGRYAFITKLKYTFAEPIPYKGRLGLWDFPDHCRICRRPMSECEEGVVASDLCVLCADELQADHQTDAVF